MRDILAESEKSGFLFHTDHGNEASEARASKSHTCVNFTRIS